MKRFLVSTTMSLALIASTAAHAQDDVARKEAQARFDEGLKLHDGGKDEDARTKFLQAYAVLKSPAVLYNLARSEQLSGHEVDAIRHYKQFLKDPSITPRSRDMARGYADELSRRVAHITVLAPAGSRVAVDGEPVDDAALADSVDVQPGRHTVTARRGEKTKSVDVTCVVGMTATAQIPDDPPPAGTGTGVGVGVGVGVGTPPPVDHVDPPHQGFWTTGHTVGVVLAGAAVVAVGIGVGFWLDGNSQDSKADTTRASLGNTNCTGSPLQGCKDLAGFRSTSDTDKTLTTVMFVGGGVLAAGAVASFLFWKDTSPRGTGAIILPVVSPSGAGAALFTRF